MSQAEKMFFSYLLGFCCLMGLFCFGFPILAWLIDSAQMLTLSKLFDSSILAVARFTLWQMSWSTLISTTVGLVLGLWVGKQVTQIRSPVVLSGFIIPLAVPTLVSALGWMTLLGRSFDILYSQRAVILAHCFYNIPLVIYLVAQARSQVQVQLLFVIRSLGGSRWDEWRLVVWPKVKWPLFSAAAQTASFCAMSFALVLILGGGPPVQSLETEVYYRLKFGEYDPAGALSCALWEFLLTFFPWVLAVFAESKRAHSEKMGDFRGYSGGSDLGGYLSLKRTVGFKREWREVSRSLWVVGCLGGLSLLFLLPYFFVFSVEALHAFGSVEFISQLWSALKVSLGISFLTSSFVLFLGVTLILSLRSSFLSVRWRVFVQLLSGAPAGVSVLILALGVWLAYGRWIDPFEGSLLAIVMIQSCIFFPLAFRMLWPLFMKEDQVSYQAAWTLGSSWREAFFEIEWPRVRFPLVAIGSGIFGACLGEVAGVSLFGSSKWMPLSLLLSHKMQHYRFAEAQAIAALMFILAMSSLGFAIVFWNLHRNQMR